MAHSGTRNPAERPSGDNSEAARSLGLDDFVEPDDQGQIVDLHLKFDADELKRVRNVAVAVWDHIKKLDLPDITGYDINVKGVKAFEDDLLKTPLK